MTGGAGADPGLPEAVRAVAPAVLDLLGRHGSDAVLVVDESHTVLWGNTRAWEAMDRPPPPPDPVLGQPRPAPAGLSLRRWVRDPALAVAVGRAFQEGVTVDEEVHMAAGQRTYRGIVVPLPGPGGDRQALVVLRDDTAARRLTRAHQDLLANLSHDLRTPLAGLRLLAETLVGEARGDREATVAFAERIAVEAERLHELVSGILDLAHIEADVDRARVEPLRLGPVVERVVERLGPVARDGGVTVQLELAEVSALADPARLEVALSNILDNAIKFTAPGGEVVVTTAMARGRPVVAVRDTGCGISAAELPRIFERFYTGDRSRASRSSGLGLPIARHAVEVQGGRVGASSELGVGTTVEIRLRPVP